MNMKNDATEIEYKSAHTQNTNIESEWERERADDFMSEWKIEMRRSLSLILSDNANKM